MTRQRESLLFGFTIFLSAFLLFQVQLLMGKFLLPWFGGAPAVWTTCLLAYQVLLLAGYTYAHVAARRGPAPGKLHGVLLATSVLLLLVLAFRWPSPITPGPNLRPEDDLQPVLSLLKILILSIGLPFFLLSTTGPLVQHWFSRARAGESPYRLYAVSNLGSLLGLLSYPLLVEPFVTLRWQGRLWTLGYVLFSLSCAACAWIAEKAPPIPSSPAPEEGAESEPPATAVTLGERLVWFSLAACASVLLIGSTNLITQDVASVPLLWVLPLALYLLTFILAFESSRWYRRAIVHPLFAVVAVLTVIALVRQLFLDPKVQIAIYSACLFTSCLVCHGELARRKPAAGQLTTFYLMVAAGGAGGGVFAALVAPVIFPAYWEFQVALWMTAFLLTVALFRDRSSWLYEHPHWLPFAIVLAVASLPETMTLARLSGMDPPMVYWYRGGLAALALVTLVVGIRFPRPRVVRFSWLQLCVVSLVLLLGYALILQVRIRAGNLVARSRNFYGVLTVWENYQGSPVQHNYQLMHGLTVHGIQLREPAYQQKATGYYYVDSGVARLVMFRPHRYVQSRPASLRAGFVGLGVGTLAVYGLPGDSFRFYEINPAVIDYASGPNALFTYVGASKAKVEIVPGDGRLSLEREAARGQLQQFDVLAVDAFTSDAIPVHLLTAEAFDLYLQHLAPDGILAVHVSNKTLDLEPVVAQLAGHFGLDSVHVSGKARLPIVLDSDWVLLSRNRSVLHIPEVLPVSRPLRRDRNTGLWTDEYSNLLSVVR